MQYNLNKNYLLITFFITLLIFTITFSQGIIFEKLIVIFFVIIFIVIFLWFSTQIGKEEGANSTIVIFGIGAIFYYITIPIELTICNQNFFMVQEIHFLEVNNLRKIEIIFLGLTAFIGFTIGYIISGLPKRFQQIKFPSYKTELSSRTFFTMSLIIIILILMFYKHLVIQCGTYIGNYTTKATESTFAFLSQCATISLVLYGTLALYQKSIRSKFLGFVCFLLVGWWSIYSSDKDPLLLVFLGLASYTFKNWSATVIRISFITFMILLLFGLGAILFSLYRSNSIIDFFSSLNKSGVYQQTDSSGPFISLIHTLENPHSIQFGLTYLKSLILWIPRFLWPNRPLDLAEQFAQQNISNCQPGQGLGFSLLAESYMNFRFLGPLICYTIIGFMWGTIWFVLFRIFGSKWKTMAQVLYTVVGYYWLIIMHRGGSNLLITNFMQVIVPIILFFILIDLIPYKITKIINIKIVKYEPKK